MDYGVDDAARGTNVSILCSTECGIMRLDRHPPRFSTIVKRSQLTGIRVGRIRKLCDGATVDTTQLRRSDEGATTDPCSANRASLLFGRRSRPCTYTPRGQASQSTWLSRWFLHANLRRSDARCHWGSSCNP